MSDGALGGVIFRVEGPLRDPEDDVAGSFFLPASVAAKVLSVPEVARLPGGPEDLVGIALVDGEIIPVVAVGDFHLSGARRALAMAATRPDPRPMLVCSYLGERVGLVGVEIVATGRFVTTDDEHIVHDGKRAAFFDLPGLFGRLAGGRWAV